jgi:hypothetical protein
VLRRHQALERLSGHKVRADLPRVQLKDSHTVLGEVKAPRSIIYRCVVPKAVSATAGTDTTIW